jgi:hypothetical protein
MINSNLESDLQEYCKTLNSCLFEDKIYLPLTYLAKSICSKRKVKQYEYDCGVVEDMVSTAITKLPEYYKPNKGKAKAAAYVLMSQYLLNRLMKNHEQSKKTIFIEDTEETELCRVVEVEIDDLELMRQTLNEHSDLVKRIKNKLHRKVARTIIAAINDPNKFRSNKNSFTISISKKCNISPQTVYHAVRAMRMELVGI